jgi:hypothetical protein
MSIIRNGIQSADLDAPIVLPTLNLDFANSQELDPRITFTRGSIGTFVNKNGLIETAAANIPRFDYDPISGECRGLLIEESRTNYWWGTQTGGGGSVSNGTATGADGVTAKKFVPTLGSTAFPGISNYTQYSIPAGSQVAGGTVDISFSGYFAAVADGLYVPDIVVSIHSSGTNYIFAELLPNLSNGGIVSKSLNAGVGWSELIAPQITLMPFGMYKVTWSVRYTQGATIRNLVDFGIQCRRKNSPSGAAGTYYADGVNGFQFSCIQYEVGRFPTSYIPTTTTAITRSTDILDILGNNFTSWFGNTSPSELSVFYSGLSQYTYNYANSLNLNSPFYWVLTNNDNTERIDFRYAGLPQVIPILNGAAYVGGVFPNASQINDIKSVALIDSKSFAIILNNGNPDYQFTKSTRLPRMPFGFTRLRIGSGATGGLPLNGTMRKLVVYPKRLSTSQALYLTQ